MKGGWVGVWVCVGVWVGVLWYGKEAKSLIPSLLQVYKESVLQSINEAKGMVKRKGENGENG